MILLVLVISALGFFLCYNLLINNRILHIISSLVCVTVFIMTTFLITINFHSHWGMKRVSTTKSTAMVSSLPKKGMDALIYQPIGTSGKNKVIIYRTSNDKKTQHTGTDKVTNYIVTNAKEPKLVTKIVKYQYKNSAMRFWFGLAQKAPRIKTLNYFYIPKGWMTLTVNQTKQIKPILKKLTAKYSSENATQMKVAGQKYVQDVLMKSMKKNPTMTKQQKQQLMAKAEKEFKVKAQRQAMAHLMPELKAELSKVK